MQPFLRSLIIAYAVLTASILPAQELQRIEFNNPGLIVDLGVGLWPVPIPVDYDEDGDLDLLINVAQDVPDGFIYFFENPQDDVKMPVFRPGVRLGKKIQNLQPSYVEGELRLLIPGHELIHYKSTSFAERKQIYPTTNIGSPTGRVRGNQWSYVDYDGDGNLDIVVGLDDWGDYGWDDAYDSQGIWTRGLLHGYVYLIHNRGTTSEPVYAEPDKIHAGGRPIDVYGLSSPNFADFDGDGDLDLICGEFVDRMTYFENIGSRTKPNYAAGRFLTYQGHALHMDECIITPVAFDWDKDGDVDLVVGQVDGRVALVENTGKIMDGIPEFLPPVFFQQESHELNFGALATPFSFDWDGDGDEDIISGNSSGYIGFIENLDGRNPPRWARPVYLEADTHIIREQAGYNGSVQGPCEAKWGYTAPVVADWDADGLPDLITNSIWGKIKWYRNIGDRSNPRLAAAQPVGVEWKDRPHHPPWNWWKPQGKELASQWRTTPGVIDLNQDGLQDLVMLDHEGFLTFFERREEKGKLILLPGKRVFYNTDHSLVYDHANRPVHFDLDEDGINDLTRLSPEGATLYLSTDPMDRQMKLRCLERFYETAESIADFQDGEKGLLRMNAGWAGRSGRRKFTLVDWDKDGRLDLLVNSLNVNYFRNISDESGQYVFEDMGMLDDVRLAGHTTSPTTVDWDKDGIPDLLVGAEDGFFYYLPNPLSRETEE